MKHRNVSWYIFEKIILGHCCCLMALSKIRLKSVHLGRVKKKTHAPCKVWFCNKIWNNVQFCTVDIFTCTWDIAAVPWSCDFFVPASLSWNIFSCFFYILKVKSDISDIYLRLHKSFQEESNFMVRTHTTEVVMKVQFCFRCLKQNLS